jgi:chain length determinant protein (polysaccharide antigen chain regulator)
MEKNTEHPAPIPPHFYYYPPMPNQDDEISLIDLWRVLVRQWKWIAAITALSVVIAAIYLWRSTPVYEVEAVLLPPEAEYAQVLNIPGISETSSAEIYSGLIRNLRSNSLRRQFFEYNHLEAAFRGNSQASTEVIFREKFNKRLSLKEDAKAGTLSVTLQGKDPELAAQWVNEFILFAGKRTIQEVVAGVSQTILNHKQVLQGQIEIAREFAKQHRLDRLAALDEQIIIARELKIMSRDDTRWRVVDSQKLVSVSTAAEPLYMRGVKELVAERESLVKRKDDDPFIPGLRENQERLTQLDAGLRQLQTAASDLTAAKLDSKAMSPDFPVKPKKRMVLALSLVLGGMLGIFAAFFINFLEQQ